MNISNILSNQVEIDQDKPSIGVIGWYDGPNYGSKLVYYAIYKMFEALKYNVSFIWHPHAPKYKFSTFALQHYNITKHLEFNRLNELNKYFDAFCVGSDQFWNYRLDLYNNYRFLDFANSQKILLSCATSFGHDSLFFPKDILREVKILLERFDTLTVREDSAAILIKKFFNVDSTILIDPTLLVNKNVYTNLSTASKYKNEDENYLLAYILDPNDEKINFIKQISNRLSLKIKTVVDIQGFSQKKEYMKDLNVVSSVNGTMPSVQTFVKLFKDAQFIITDSFHGTCFSIIFEKQFLTFKNIRRGGIRFSMFDKLGCSERILSDINQTPKILDSFDYSSTNIIIDLYRKLAFSLFEATLSIDKSKYCASNAYLEYLIRK